MLTTFRLLSPMEKAAGGCRDDLWRTEMINGVKVVRVWHYVPTKITTTEADPARGQFSVSVVFSRPGPRGVRCHRRGFAAAGPGLFLVDAFAAQECAVHFSRAGLAARCGACRSACSSRAISRGSSMRSRVSPTRRRRASAAFPRGMVAAFRRKNVPAEKSSGFRTAWPCRDGITSRAGRVSRKYGIGPEYCVATYSGNIGASRGWRFSSSLRPSFSTTRSRSSSAAMARAARKWNGRSAREG
jgi:ferredoxin